MKEYAFDCKLWAVCRVTAPDVKTAREKMQNVVDCLDIGYDQDGVKLTEASIEGEGDLFEIDGEAV
jgi:hypothetical protein